MERVPPPGRGAGLPALPLLALGVAEALWRDADGRSERIGLDEVRRRLDAAASPLLCFRPAIARRFGLKNFPAFDVLELYAFVRPARFCLPTIRGVAEALSLPSPRGLEAEADALQRSVQALLAELGADERAYEAELRPIAQAMAAGGWNWAPAVLAALGITEHPRGAGRAVAGLDVWRDLPEWAERGPEPPAGDVPVEPAEADARLLSLLGPKAEVRPQQRAYAAAVTHAFTPRDRVDAPKVAIAEAGTGVGKTLGYVAPASVWAEKNAGAVWISTFTRNLQHQIDQELDKLYPDANEKRRKVVLRKGRENYLCLLNYEEAATGARLRLNEAPQLGLIARWIARTRDGALVAGDLPGWLADLAGRGLVASLTDRRGECIYSACPHYSRCFIEHAVRRSRRARLVVANHALVMIQAALAAADGDGRGDADLPLRYVFDEGHHVFGAADSVFSGHLTGIEMAELRRWVRGAEAGSSRRSRTRGLRARLLGLLEDDPASERLLNNAVAAAGALPSEGWLGRVASGEGVGAAERFLGFVRQQVYARTADADSGYGLECDLQPLVPGLEEAAAELDKALAGLLRPLTQLAERLALRLEAEAETLETSVRIRLDSMARAIKRRTLVDLSGWRAMLAALGKETPPEYVDWFAVEREFGRDRDVGAHRHWIDPTLPFAEHVLRPAHGAVVTSASLRDGTGEPSVDWAAAEERTGARHLLEPAEHAALDSPFDYAKQTRLFVVRDVAGDNANAVAAAFRELFIAAGGGALGLFTAIARLRQVHQRIAAPLEERGIPLLAQHIDGYDVATLVDIFRAEPDACLLGTDAVRDGVDVPGRSLRLIVFDRVPWPRPDILYRARHAHFGGARYTDRETRFRLKQAFGRLIRRADDCGVFVMLDPRLPTRLCGAFPPGVEVRRVGLAEAIAETKAFLAGTAPQPSA
jgi:ATP-dependent DNA helicase DinG